MIYSISAYHRTNKYSIIDRGANGGVSGDYVRIININPDSKVDVRGIDNH